MRAASRRSRSARPAVTPSSWPCCSPTRCPPRTSTPCTEDLGRVQDERLTLVGRSKDTVIVHGVSYSGRALEAVLREIPGVDASCVAAISIRQAGSDTEQLAVLFANTLPATDEHTLHR